MILKMKIFSLFSSSYGIFKFVDTSLINFNFLDNVIFDYCIKFYNDFNISNNDINSFYSLYLNNINDKIGFLLNTNFLSLNDNRYYNLSIANPHEEIILNEIASKLLTVIDK